MLSQYQTFLLALFGLTSVACAQYTTSSAATTSEGSSPSGTSSSAATTHTISVGKANHVFAPDVTQANVGDIIEFEFFPRNHSVARAEYKLPCIPYELTGRGKVGFFSGFRPVDAILPAPPSWSIRINDTDPIFFYCTAPGSCIDYGMVGVINPNASVSLVTQQDLAKKSKYMLNPGEDFPAEVSSSIVSLAATATATSISGAASIPSSSSSSSHHGLSTGAIVGIAIGGAATLILAAALFFYIGRTKKLQQHINRNSTFAPTAGTYGPPSGPPDMMYSGAVPFVPVNRPDMRHSHMSHPAEAPPYNELSEADMNDMASMRSMSPRMSSRPSPRSPFTEFGGVYNPHQSPPLDRMSKSMGVSTTPVPPQSQGPHEMYAPLPK